MRLQTWISSLIVLFGKNTAFGKESLSLVLVLSVSNSCLGGEAGRIEAVRREAGNNELGCSGFLFSQKERAASCKNLKPGETKCRISCLLRIAGPNVQIKRG